MPVLDLVLSSSTLLVSLLYLTYIRYATCLSIPVAVQPRSSSYTFDEHVPKLNIPFNNYAVLPIAKFNTSQATLQILDMAAMSWNGSIIIQRVIVNPMRPEFFLSQAFLDLPSDHNQTLETTKLSVDFAKMSDYWALLSSPPFTTGSLQNQRNATGNVVVVGLGAGQLNNYLHYHFPKLNITAVEIEPSFAMVAKKYFGFREDATQQLFIIDGVKFLAKAASDGKKYDAIYIDACPSMDHNRDEVLCPAKAFLNTTNILNMKRALSENGTVVVKMLLVTKDVPEKAMELSKPYRQIFGNCVVLPMISTNNRMLVCSGKAIKKLDVEWLWNKVAHFSASE